MHTENKINNGQKDTFKQCAVIIIHICFKSLTNKHLGRPEKLTYTCIVVSPGVTNQLTKT